MGGGKKEDNHYVPILLISPSLPPLLVPNPPSYSKPTSPTHKNPSKQTPGGKGILRDRVATWQLCPSQATWYSNRCHRGVFFSSETTHGYKSQKSSTEQCKQLLSHRRSPEARWLNCDDFSSSTLLCTQICFLFPFCHWQLEVAHLPLVRVSKPLSRLQALHSSHQQAAAEQDFLALTFSEQENLSQNSPGSLSITSHWPELCPTPFLSQSLTKGVESSSPWLA